MTTSKARAFALLPSICPSFSWRYVPDADDSELDERSNNKTAYRRTTAFSFTNWRLK